MDLICYAAMNCPEGAEVLARLQAKAPVRRTLRCRTIEELNRCLLRPLGDVLAVVLFLADDADLARILTLKDVLDETRVVLVLPEWDPDLVTGGHSLRPRFMTSRGFNIEELHAVLNKLAGKLSNSQDFTHSKGRRQVSAEFGNFTWWGAHQPS